MRLHSALAKNIKSVLIGIVMMAVTLLAGSTLSVYAQVSVNDGVCDGLTAAGVECGSSGASGDEIKPAIQTIVDILSIIVGTVSVIMIIVGGFRYVISNGDSNGLASAKNTILYAIVGLAVVIFAQVIVRFVYSTVKTDGSSGSSSGSSTAPAPAEN
ncbi:MAG: pilin [Candidatus Saccharimonadales bacterium]